VSRSRPDDGELDTIVNPNSLETLNGYVEPSLANVTAGEKLQFERTGYFCADPDSTPGKPVFNLTVTLKDSWAREQKKG